MRYHDQNRGMTRETLERFMSRGERLEDLFHPQNGCLHYWERCVHRGVGSEGSHSACAEISFYLEMHHGVCRNCGRIRYVNRGLAVAESVLESRRLASEKKS